MKRNDVFTFTAPNGVEVTGVVIDIIRYDRDWKWYLCYAQNRIFHYQIISTLIRPVVTISVEYAVLPEFDVILENYAEEITEI